MTIVQVDDTVNREAGKQADAQLHTNLDEGTRGRVIGSPLGLRRRAVIGLAAALVAGAYVLWFDALTHQYGPGGSDFDQLWFAARVLVHGRDPYQAIGPGRAFEWGWPLLYPLPTVIAVLPFAALPLLAARIAFVGISAGLLAFALSARGFAPLIVFFSAAIADA